MAASSSYGYDQCIDVNFAQDPALRSPHTVSVGPHLSYSSHDAGYQKWSIMITLYHVCCFDKLFLFLSGMYYIIHTLGRWMAGKACLWATLKKTFGTCSVELNELITLICEMEHSVNCRSDNPDYIQLLTPERFLVNKVSVSIDDVT